MKKILAIIISLICILAVFSVVYLYKAPSENEEVTDYPYIVFELGMNNLTVIGYNPANDSGDYWEDIKIIMGDLTLPEGEINIGDVITNCSGYIVLRWETANYSLGPWFFKEDNDLCFSVDYDCHSHGVSAYDEQDLGIKNITWLNDDIVHIKAYQSYNCAYNVTEGSYEKINNTISLEYDVDKRGLKTIIDGEVVYLTADCLCAFEFNYFIKGIQKEDYNFELSEILTLPDIEFEVNPETCNVTVKSVNNSNNLDLNWSNIRIYLSDFSDDYIIPTGNIITGDVIQTNCTESISVYWYPEHCEIYEYSFI